jgi:UDP-N-acetyl-2-amino-2-deoxyglucuronate dehydrogenase
MKPLRTGIVGCGKVAAAHASALSRLAESKFTAVFSRSEEKGVAFAARFGVRAFTNLRSFLGELDAAVVCTPHPFHVEPTVAACQAGVHVLVEKPLASTLGHCDAMIQAAHAAGVRLGMVSQRRWYAPVRRVKQAIEDGLIGAPVLGTAAILGWRDQAYYNADPWRGTWEGEGGGILVNQAPHQLDLLQWFMGPVDTLFGQWDNLNHPYIEVEDTAVAVIRFANGALGSIVVSNSQRPGIYGKVHVHGASGASVGVQTDSGAMFVSGMTGIAEPPVLDLWTVPGQEQMKERWNREDVERFSRVDATEYYHELQTQEFLQAVREDREPAVTGEEGRKTVEIFTAVYRSQRDGRPVKFPLQPEEGRGDCDGRLKGG